MKKSRKELSLFLLLISCSLFSVSVYSAPQSSKIIYGEDNRRETYEVSKAIQKVAESTAGMIDSIKLISIGSHYILPPSTIGSSMDLCKGERFQDQPSSVSCSGFLVGPDLLVTAGHCITNQETCESVSWVFDYKVEEHSKKASLAIPKEKVFKCKRVIEAKLEGIKSEMRDYSLVQLDREVKGRKPLRFRKSGAISKGQELIVIGHPSGLPQKVADKGKVFDVSSTRFFKTNLDTFGGNSGSAVFNANTLMVEGILVRGATDYVRTDCGVVVNEVEEDITGNASLGESVSRITDIPALRLKGKFFQAVQNDDVNTMLSILEETKGPLYLYDEDKNTALHIAVKANANKALKLLVNNKVDLNIQNNSLETPLHLAAYVNNKFAIRFLIKNGANPLLLDKYKTLPSGRTNYLAFYIRKVLKEYESEMRSKR